MRDCIRWFKCKLKPPKNLKYYAEFERYNNIMQKVMRFPEYPGTLHNCFGGTDDHWAKEHAARSRSQNLLHVHGYSAVCVALVILICGHKLCLTHL